MNVLNLNPYNTRTTRFEGGSASLLEKKEKTEAKPLAQKELGNMPRLNGAYFGVKPVKFGAQNPNYVGTPLLINPEFTTQFEEANQRPYSWGNSPFESRFNSALGELQSILNESGGTKAEKPSRDTLGQLQRILVKNGIVKISGPVTDQMAEMVQERVNILVSIMKKTEKVQPINFLINSPGGSILAMNSITDTMDQARATKIKGKAIPIATYVQGYAASAASVITANGTPGYRSMSKKAEIMIHQPLGGASGQATEIEIAYKKIMRAKAQINEFFAEVTNMKREEIDRVMERDYWMEAEESKEKGFVDKIVTQLPGLKLTDEDEESFVGACVEGEKCEEPKKAEPDEDE